MKKLLVVLFAGLFLSSVCFAQEPPASAQGADTAAAKTVEKKKGKAKKAERKAKTASGQVIGITTFFGHREP